MHLIRHRKLLCLFILLCTPQLHDTTTPYQVTPQDSSGIVFNRIRTVILAEKYDYVKFLLPFPQLKLEFDPGLFNISATISRHWNTIPGDCPELHDRVVPEDETGQLLTATNEIFQHTQEELHAMKTELDQILTPPTTHRRQKRMVMTMAAAAAGAGLLTLGAYASGGCIAGVLGPCHDKRNIALNRANLQATMQRLAQAETKWEAIQTQNQEKFYVVASDLKNLHENQRLIQQNQEELWNATQATLQGLGNALQRMTICTEFLFTRTQLNLLRTTLASRLHILHASLQGFRAALWSYRATLLDSIPNMAVGLLPMSLVPRDTLLQILDALHLSQGRTDEHLTLALSLNNILRYYETPLVTRAETTEDGLLLTLAIPLTSRELILDVYKAIVLPMPHNDSLHAQIWKLETPYLAVTKNHKETALLNEDQLLGCKGPKDAAVCQQGFATTRNRGSCLASLFFHTASHAADVCETDIIQLPNIGQS